MMGAARTALAPRLVCTEAGPGRPVVTGPAPDCQCLLCTVPLAASDSESRNSEFLLIEVTVQVAAGVTASELRSDT
jgi:hypothetical protein